MKKRIIALILVSILLLMTSACISNNEPTATVTPGQSGNSETRVFSDSAGRQVEIPTNLTRIAASGYVAQIVLFSLAPEMLVGLAEEWSDVAEQYLDPEYLDLPVLGSFYGSGDLNLEEVAARDPQVIIDIGEPKSSIVEDMDGITQQVGIPAVHIETNLEMMPEAYRMLGKLLNKEQEAEELAKYCENVLVRTQEIAEQVGEEGMKSLLYCMGGEGLNVIAQGTYHAQVIDMLSNNLAVVENASSKGTGNPVDMEQLLNWDPEVIIFAPDSIYETVSDDPSWQLMQAISEGNYYKVPEAPYNWMSFPPSINRYLGMVWLAQLLYPDTADYDMFEETSKFFELFYNHTLTESQYEELIADSFD